MNFWLLFIFAAPLLAGVPKLTFTKVFPASTPPYVSVTIDRAGNLEYTEAQKDDAPLKAHMSEAEVAPLFDLAQQLQYFKEPIESSLKVANTGKKTFRYVDGSGSVTEAVFNYSALPAAQTLLDDFENIASTERAFIDLDRTVRFDKLGVNDSLAQIESLWLHKQLAAPDQFIPLLQRIATHETYMHLARERAARLKEEFSGASTGTASLTK
jgi:hypothetical protein